MARLRRPQVWQHVPSLRWRRRLDQSIDAGIRAFNMIRLSGTTHAVNSDARFVPVEFEVAANGTDYTLFMNDNPNVLIPGFYWIFALNGKGVPSIGFPIQVVRANGGTGGPTTIVKFDNPDVVTNVASKNESLRYDNHASGTGAITYTWDFGDGSIVSNDNGVSTHAYAANRVIRDLAYTRSMNQAHSTACSLFKLFANHHEMLPSATEIVDDLLRRCDQSIPGT
ncbi:MAG: DUF1929 domain-containing protein [Polyangiales bacterium]